MHLRLAVLVPLGQAKVDEEQFIEVAAHTHQEVIGLNVAMYEPQFVDTFYAHQQLVG